MTIGESMLAVYRNERSERIPVGIYGRYLPRGSCERLARELGLGLIESYPLVSLLAPPWHTYSNFLSEVPGANLRIEHAWQDGQRVEIRSYETPVGTVRQVLTTDPAFGSDWILEFYVKHPEDYKTLTYLVEHTVFRRQERGFATASANLGDDGIVLGRVDRSPYQKVLVELAGPERFLVDLQTDPEPVGELLEAIERRLNEAFAMVLESRAELIWQPENLTADMTPPPAFARYNLSFYEKVGAALHAAGKRYVVHMDGRLRALKELIGRSPVDVIESFSLPMMGNDLTLAEARAAWPNKVLLPNFPAALAHRPDREIETFLGQWLAESGVETPWMLQFSEDIPPDQWQRVVPLVCHCLNEAGRSKG
jgi:hypothetical protein